MHSLDALRCVGGYLRKMGSGLVASARRVVAFLEFEDGWDAAGYICLSLGLALMLIGTLAAPDLPALSLWADEDGIAIAPGPRICVTNDCTTLRCFTRDVGDCESAPPAACRVGELDQCKDCKCVLNGACGCYVQ